MKVSVLDVYSDVFTGIGKFPGAPYKFQLKPNAKPMGHALQMDNHGTMAYSSTE